jgi:putative salt-induced outer membrane protein YdiY
MKLKSVVLVLFLSISWGTYVFAQEKPEEQPKYGWQKEMVGGINLTQTSLSNWTQGGENSFAWQLNFNFKFINNREKFNWANSGKLTYGSTKIGDQEFRKSLDEIKLESVLTYKFGKQINPYVALTAETQFGPGYNYGTEPKTQISSFMDPGYFRESIGVGYKPNDIVKTRLGVALKQTFTSDYPIPYADDPDTVDKIEKTKNEFGAESVTDISWKITKNSLFTSKLELFYAFKAFDETDVNWDNVFTIMISKYINININFKLFYDKDISNKRQIKQAIAFGLSYSFL